MNHSSNPHREGNISGLVLCLTLLLFLLGHLLLDLRWGLLLAQTWLTAWLLLRLRRCGSTKGLGMLSGALAAGLLLLLPQQHAGEGVTPKLIGMILCGAMLATSLICLLIIRRKKTVSTSVDVVSAWPEATPAGRFNRGDAWILIAIMSIYAIFVYTTIGSVNAPQTSAVLPDEGAWMFDLGQAENAYHLHVYHQCAESSTLIVETSTDGETWLAVGDIFLDPMNAWSWCTTRDENALNGRYVRLTSSSPALSLLEVVFHTTEGAPIPVQAGNEAATALLDEQQTLTGEPSWKTSAFFDEPFYIRAALELSDGLSVTDWSHPPLSKLLIGLGISLFGVTPFGWRFASATAGILTLAAVYLMGRELFEKRRYAVLATVLLALDPLHLVQSRAALLDSFTTMFVLWAFALMVCWVRREQLSAGRSLGLLAGVGALLGLASACKWNGIFAAVGLLVLLVYSLLRQKRPHGVRTAIGGILLLTVLPLGIYSMTFIPLLASAGGWNPSALLAQNQLMLHFHSVAMVNADHPFASPWYTWPLSASPVLYWRGDIGLSTVNDTLWLVGNPVIWWPGFLCVIAMGVLACLRLFLPCCDASFSHRETDSRPLLLLTLFASMWLPWSWVARGTFLYHYMPVLPVMMLCIACALEVASACMEQRCATDTARVRVDRVSMIICITLALVAAVSFCVAIF